MQLFAKLCVCVCVCRSDARPAIGNGRADDHLCPWLTPRISTIALYVKCWHAGARLFMLYLGSLVERALRKSRASAFLGAARPNKKEASERSTADAVSARSRSIHVAAIVIGPRPFQPVYGKEVKKHICSCEH